MKTRPFVVLIVIFILFSCLSISAWANPELNNIAREFNRVQDQLKQSDKDQPALEKEKADLIRITDTWKEAVRGYRQALSALKAETQTHNADTARQHAQVAQHNANRPDPRDTAAVNAYNAEVRRLKNWGDQIDARKSQLDRRASDLKWSGEALERARIKDNEMVNNWTRKWKAWQARREELTAKLKDLKRRACDTCLRLLRDPSTKDEALKWGCGTFFDGSDPNLPTLEEIGIKPPFKATPN